MSFTKFDAVLLKLRWPVVILALAGVFILLVLYWHPGENENAWKIIRQRTNDHYHEANYGFIDENGFKHLGCSNKVEAVAKMKQHRQAFRNPKKPESMFEFVE